jgi:hypothetical protein
MSLQNTHPTDAEAYTAMFQLSESALVSGLYLTTAEGEFMGKVKRLEQVCGMLFSLAHWPTQMHNRARRQDWSTTTRCQLGNPPVNYI